MKHGSLFSGIGGFDLAAEWMGWENIFHCEWNEFGKKVLKHYWPKAISYHDITKTDFTIHRGTIDILTGGFPCQPYSQAGKRLGKADDRHLWPEMLRAIREIQPRWIVGENVRGLTNWNGGMVFDEVQSDLEVEGYEILPFLLPACGVNAPHRRDRVWFVAYAVNGGYSARRAAIQEENRIPCNSRQEMESRQFDGTSIPRPTPDSRLFGSPQRQEQSMGTKQLRQERDAADTSNKGLEGRQVNRGSRKIRQESYKFTTRRICSNWQNFPTVSPVCNGDDGLSERLDGITFPKWRNESIKAGGNAVVPQLVYQIFKAIEQYESNHTNTWNSSHRSDLLDSL